VGIHGSPGRRCSPAVGIRGGPGPGSGRDLARAALVGGGRRRAGPRRGLRKRHDGGAPGRGSVAVV